MPKAKKQKQQIKVPGTDMKTLRRAKREVPQNVIYIGRIPNKFTENTLRKFVLQFGAIKNVVISRSPSTGRSRGYGFIEFEDAESAVTAASELNGCFLHNKSIVANLHSSKNPNTFFRPDQRRRIHCDMTHRLNGYISPIIKTPRSTKEEAQAALDKLVQVEARVNKKNKDAGISYVFDGFAVQKSMI